MFVHIVNHFRLFDDVCHKRFISCVAKKYLIITSNDMYGDKKIYLTASFYKDINDPIILKTAHFINYNLPLSNVLDGSLVFVKHLDWFDSLS